MANLLKTCFNLIKVFFIMRTIKLLAQIDNYKTNSLNCPIFRLFLMNNLRKNKGFLNYRIYELYIIKLSISLNAPFHYLFLGYLLRFLLELVY